jgi:tetratricopeptide (TPR) repeat protein
MTQFSEGDIIYIFYKEEFYLYKILKVDEATGTYHVLAYETQEYMPYKEKTNELPVKIYHAPVDIDAFKDAKLFTYNEVTEYELQGYYEYLKQTQNPEKVKACANILYLEACYFAKNNDFEEAIEKYTSAISLLPNFFKAIDNRAFCKMDLGAWEDAIEDFEISLSVNPGVFIAEFSIGECYLNLDNPEKAKEQFKKALAIDPSSEIAKEFLVKAADEI